MGRFELGATGNFPASGEPPRQLHDAILKPMASGSFFKRPGVVLLIGLGVVGGLVSLAERLFSNRASSEKRTVLADLSQSRSCPAFSPDGRKLAFCARPANGAQGDFRISVSELTAGRTSGAVLTRGVGSETSPAFSPDGEKLAFLRLNGKGVDHGAAQAVVAPLNALGDAAAERVLPLGWDDKEVDAERARNRPTRAIAWTADGKSLVVISPPALALLPLDTGKIERLTNPGNDLSDRGPAVSPDGRYLAFVRGAVAGEEGGEGADIYICDPSGGNLTRLTYDNDEVGGLDWSADGREIVYAAARGTGWHLWRISAAGGSPREVLSAGTGAGEPAVARAGHKLAFTDAPVSESIWRKRIDWKKDAENTAENAAAGKDEAGGEPWIRTGASETYPAFSPDGRQVADVSSQGGSEEVWLTDVQTGGRVRVTNFHGPVLRNVHWSPDGRTLLINALNGGAAIDAVAASARAGNPAPVHVASGFNPSFRAMANRSITSLETRPRIRGRVNRLFTSWEAPSIKPGRTALKLRSWRHPRPALPKRAPTASLYTSGADAPSGASHPPAAARKRRSIPSITCSGRLSRPCPAASIIWSSIEVLAPWIWLSTASALRKRVKCSE